MNILVTEDFISISFIFEYNKDFTEKFAITFLVMTSTHEAVMSLTGNFFKNVFIGQELKLTKFQCVSVSPLSVVWKNRGGHIDPLSRVE